MLKRVYLVEMYYKKLYNLIKELNKIVIFKKSKINLIFSLDLFLSYFLYIVNLIY